MTGREYYKWLYKKRKLKVVVWEKIYKREFLLNNKLFFKKDRLHEDEIFNVEVFLSANRVKFYEIYFYNYIIREGSITTNKSDKNFKDLEKSIFEIYEIMNKEEDIEMKTILSNNIHMLYRLIMSQTTNEILKKKLFDNYIKLSLIEEPVNAKAYYTDNNYLEHLNVNFRLNKETELKDILVCLKRLNKKEFSKYDTKVIYLICINMMMSIVFNKKDLKYIIKIFFMKGVKIKHKIKMLKKYCNPKKYENRIVYELK